jgi:DNA-binding transcriptional ArsR family regulator
MNPTWIAHLPALSRSTLSGRKSKGETVKDGGSAERLKALGHPVRLAIVRALAERSCCCCADVCSRLPLAQSTVSQHLKVLKEAGLISFRRDGVRSSYVLNPSAFAALHSDLKDILALVAAPKNGAQAAREVE